MPPVLWCSQSPEGGVVDISLKVEPSRVTCSQYLDKLWIPSLTPVKTNLYLMRLIQNLSWEPPDLLYLSVHLSAISYHVTLRSIGAKPRNTSSDTLSQSACPTANQPTMLLQDCMGFVPEPQVGIPRARIPTYLSTIHRQHSSVQWPCAVLQCPLQKGQSVHYL